ncbi:uncharacterized protein RCO7_14132 [Rhynchosporium graminicola]|uniref:Uncharacterized protein n=2 Tax=Rhynchosporium TaxID=38037 RepID=A0A1E1M8U1_RHYSE|nr:uncharacterized protein RCO7_14132 [Rhynchosporium commune]CZT45522.1 uncharacterized protein RSE6_16071 [Rhynchosporium secalis]
MTIVPSDYGNLGDFRGGGGMKAPLFTFIFVALSLVLNIEQIISRISCYNRHMGRLHPALVLCFDLLTCLGLLFSSYFIIYPTMYQFPLAKDLIWVSTVLAILHIFLFVFACIACDNWRKNYNYRNQQEVIRRGRERALRLHQYHDEYIERE